MFWQTILFVKGLSAGAQWAKWNIILIASNKGVIPFCGMTFNQGNFFFKFSTHLGIFIHIWKNVIEYIQSVMYYIIYISLSTCYRTLYYFFPFNFKILKYVISDIEIRVLWNRYPLFPPIYFYFYVLSINSCSSRTIHVYYLLAFLYMNYKLYLHN
jgi:hypothetical protein